MKVNSLNYFKVLYQHLPERLRKTKPIISEYLVLWSKFKPETSVYESKPHVPFP
jgi:hypothetical protein